MCGIFGFVDQTKKLTLDHLKTSTDMVKYRGMDDKGYVLKSYGKHNVGFGHRRLSIIDLSSEGHQPWEFENLIITYNGEIYNFMEIKAELEELGYTFRSNSDTEVVIKAFHRWGVDCINRFNGMFAFAIYNREREELYLVRDRIGIKPLFYSFVNGVFSFASDIVSIRKLPSFSSEIDLTSLYYYFCLGFIDNPKSIYQHAKKLEPGHWLKFSGGEIQICPYWNIYEAYNKGKVNLIMDYQAALMEFHDILKDSVKKRMISDVPVGTFLSGGYDSTLVTAVARSIVGDSIKTFTIGNVKKSYDEAPYSRKIAEHLGTDHHELYPTIEEYQDALSNLCVYYNEPFADSSQLPTMLVSKLAKSKVSVSLSGDGGDEVFAGYRTFANIQTKKKLIQFAPFWRLFGLLNLDLLASKYYEQALHLPYMQDVETAIMSTQMIYRKLSRKLLLSKQNHDIVYHVPDITNNVIDKISLFLIKTSLVDDMLNKVDRASMAYTLEVRVPLLDYRLVEFAFRLPPAMKVKGTRTKCILKDTVHQYVPKELMERPKMGFSVPVDDWLMNEFRDEYAYLVSPDFLKKQGIFNPVYVEKLFGDRSTKYMRRLNWYLFVFQKWWNQYENA